METNNTEIRRLLYADLFFLGFTTIGVQIILFREFLVVFSGNEIVLGLLFMVWMFVTAFGAWLAKYFKAGIEKKTTVVRILQAGLVIFSFTAVFGIEYFRNYFFLPGRLLGPLDIFWYTVVFMVPVCTPGGILFTLLNGAVLNLKGKPASGYAFESFGSISGGVVVSLFIVYWFQISNFNALIYIALLNFIFIGISEFIQERKTGSFLFLLLAIFFILIANYLDFGKIGKEAFFKSQKVLHEKETPYGKLTITEIEGQRNVYRDGVLLYATGNSKQREEDIHYAMLQASDARKVLLVGGGVTGTLSEILKYPYVEEIDYVEQDRSIFDLVDAENGPDNNAKINTIESDGISFVKHTNKTFDVILVNQPPPTTAQFNRFYTTEFYSKIKNKLSTGGVFCTGLPASANYLSEDEVAMLSVIYNSLLNSFKEVTIIRGEKIYFLASDRDIDLDYESKIKTLPLGNSYVNQHYVFNSLLSMRTEQLKETLSASFGDNSNYQPIAYFSYLKYWLSQFGILYFILPGFALLALIVFLILTKIETGAMLTSGFTGAGTEMILLFVAQVLIGNLYVFLGLLVTAFMGGLCVGAFTGDRLKFLMSRKWIYRLQLLSGVFIVLMALIINKLNTAESETFIKTIVVLLILLMAIITGLQYGISVNIGKSLNNKLIAKVYSADLLGAALGSFLTFTFLIPVFGVVGAVLSFSVLHFLTIILYQFKAKIKYL